VQGVVLGRSDNFHGTPPATKSNQTSLKNRRRSRNLWSEWDCALHYCNKIIHEA
jgi:hypothetical protein